jgi:hypothetical protein
MVTVSRAQAIRAVLAQFERGVNTRIPVYKPAQDLRIIMGTNLHTPPDKLKLPSAVSEFR